MLAKAAPGKLFYGSGGNGRTRTWGVSCQGPCRGVDLVHVPRLNRLRRATEQGSHRGLTRPDTKKRLTDLGLDAVGNTPAQAAKLVDDEIQRWTAVIKAANIKAD